MDDLASEFNLGSPEEVVKLRGMKTRSLANERARGIGPPFVNIQQKVVYPSEGLRKYIGANSVTPRRVPTLIDGRRRRA